MKNVVFPKYLIFFVLTIKYLMLLKKTTQSSSQVNSDAPILPQNIPLTLHFINLFDQQQAKEIKENNG